MQKESALILVERLQFDSKSIIINLMSHQENRKSFQESINFEVCQFLEKVQKLYQSHQVQFQLSRTQILDTILQSIIPPEENQPISNQMLSHFLQQTLNNESEKVDDQFYAQKLKKMYCTRDMTHISGTTKIFGHSDSMVMNQPNIRDSSITHRSVPTPESQFNKPSLFFNQVLSATRMKDQVSSIISNKSESDSAYQSKSSSQTKKPYKLYPTYMKLQAVQYATKNGIKQACQKYKIPSSKIGVWFRSFSKVKQVRGRKPIDPQMEEKVCRWLRKQLDRGTVLTQKIIREKAKKISCSDDFKASKGWLQKFFKRRPQLFEAYSENRKASNQNFALDEGNSSVKVKKQEQEVSIDFEDVYIKTQDVIDQKQEQ